jgi:hypothetical protein
MRVESGVPRMFADSRSGDHDRLSRNRARVLPTARRLRLRVSRLGQGEGNQAVDGPDLSSALVPSTTWRHRLATAMDASPASPLPSGDAARRGHALDARWRRYCSSWSGFGGKRLELTDMPRGAYPVGSGRRERASKGSSAGACLPPRRPCPPQGLKDCGGQGPPNASHDRRCGRAGPQPDVTGYADAATTRALARQA